MDRLAVIEKFAGKMSQERREDLPSKAFAVPAKKAKKIGVAGEIKGEAKGKYPIPDMKHARNALARVSQHGTPAEREAVRKKVYSKFPGLKEGFEEAHGGESPTAKEHVKKVEQGGIGKGSCAGVKMAAMADELMKIKLAGVEMHIEGYHRDPDKYWGPHLEWRERREEAGGPTPSWGPGLLARRRYDKAWKKRESKLQKWEKKNPDPLNAMGPKEWDYAHESRVKTPFDDKQYGKLNSRILAFSDTAQTMATDHAYSDKPVTRNLTDADMDKLITSFEKHRTNEAPEEEKAFIQKIKHLKADPKAKIYRLEYS